MARRLVAKPDPMRALVFCYGSNLWRPQLRERCPGVIELGAATLEGWLLGWAGQSPRWGGPVATVYPSRQGTTQGALVGLTMSGLMALDGYEGEGTVYMRLPVQVRLRGKSQGCIDAWTYVHRRQPLREGPGPSARYVARIAAGLAEYGWGLDGLDAALAPFALH